MSHIHPLAEVASLHIGENTRIWQFAIVLKGAKIGKNCNINCHTFIENDVIIGDHVTVKSGVYLWDGIRVEDCVFIGPNATFSNDAFPRSKSRPVTFSRVILKEGASLGAGCKIMAGITIGRYAMIGMGTLITKDVPDFALVYGTPAKIQGWVDEAGNKLEEVDKKLWRNRFGKYFIETENGLEEK